MGSATSTSGFQRRIVVAAVSVIAVLLVVWAGPAMWWVATECRAFCTPDDASGPLRLRGGGSVPLVGKSRARRPVDVDYLTQFMQDRPRLCEEAREVFEVLRANGDLAEAHEVMLSPTDGRKRMLGLTWRGPVFACCISTGVIFEKDEDADWRTSSGVCGG
jgi:hypothetical protein